MTELQTLANIAQILSLPISILALILAIIIWRYPTPPPLTPIFRRALPFLRYISIAAFSYWLGTRTFVSTPLPQNDMQATITAGQATIAALQTRTVGDSGTAVSVAPPVTAVTQNAVTQVAITQIAVTQVAVTQVVVTQIVATSPPLVVTATPPPAPTIQANLIFKDTFDSGIRSEWKVLADQPLTVDGRLTASTEKLTVEYWDNALQNFAMDFDLSTGGTGITIVIGGQLRLVYEQGYGTHWDHLVNANWQGLANSPNIGDAQHVRIEVKGSTYTVEKNNGQQKSAITANVAGQGPIQFIIPKGCLVDNFIITTLP